MPIRVIPTCTVDRKLVGSSASRSAFAAPRLPALPHGDRADEFSVDINGTAAHALQHSGPIHRSAAEASKDDGLPGTCVFEDAQDLDFKVLDAGTLKHRLANSYEAGAEVF